MLSPAALIAIVAWANIMVAALEGWRDLLGYLPWALHGAPRAVMLAAAVYLTEVFLTMAAGLRSWERRPWARLWLLFASGLTLLRAATLIYMHGLSVWWPSAGNLGIFGWLGGTVRVTGDVVAGGTLTLFSLPAVRREFAAPGRRELIAIRVVMACFLLFSGTELWRQVHESRRVTVPRPRPRAAIRPPARRACVEPAQTGAAFPPSRQGA